MVTVLVVEEDRAFDDAAGHAGEHLAAALAAQAFDLLPADRIRQRPRAVAVVARGHRLDVFAVDELHDASGAGLAQVRGARVFEHHLAELRDLLAKLVLAVPGDDARRSRIVNDDRLQALGAHCRARTTAGGVACRAALGVRDRHRGAGHAAFARRADGGGGAGHERLADELAVEVVVRAANEIIGFRKARAVAVDVEAVEAVLRSTVYHQGLDSEAREPVSQLPADVRFLGAARERALEGEARTSAGGHCGATEQTRAEEELCIAAERVDARVRLFEQHGRPQRPSAKQRIPRRRSLFADSLRGHIHADDAVDLHRPLQREFGRRYGAWYRSPPD